MEDVVHQHRDSEIHPLNTEACPNYLCNDVPLRPVWFEGQSEAADYNTLVYSQKDILLERDEASRLAGRDPSCRRLSWYIPLLR